jgi:hypothetical protein
LKRWTRLELAWLLGVVAAAIALGALLAARSFSDDDSGAGGPPPTPTPYMPAPTAIATEREAPGGVYPHGTRTGVPAADAVIELVERRDVIGLVDRTLFESRPCSRGFADVSAYPRCLPSEPLGTPTDSVHYAGCPEGGMLRRDDAARNYGASLEQPVYLRAVYVLEPEASRALPRRYVLVFSSSPEFMPSFSVDESGRIVEPGNVCNLELAFEGREPLLAPK